MYEAFPLQWPAGYKRTREDKRISSQFKQTMSGAQSFLKREIDRLKATGLIISTNIPVRKNDGGFYSEWMNRRMDEDLKGEELKTEIERSKAMSTLANGIIDIAKVSVDAIRLISNGKMKNEDLPLMLNTLKIKED